MLFCPEDPWLAVRSRLFRDSDWGWHGILAAIFSFPPPVPTTSSGWFILTRLMGSTYPYTKWIVDLRKYWSVGKDHLIYLQVYGKFLWGKEIPFRNMAMLGGDKLLRGYFRGRYRDHNIILAQAEYHSPPIWRFSFVAFAGAGDVFHSASTIGNLKIKQAGGIGFRYKVFRDRRMNVRIDFALGNHDSGIYLGILEAF